MSFQNFRTGTLYVSSKMVGSSYIDYNAKAILSLAKNNMDFVFGGARTGMMGLVSDLALAAGRNVTGVMPLDLAEAGKEHPKLEDIALVDGMAPRRREMTSGGDCIINFSGGVGTADEGIEAALWLHQGLHNKPIIFAAPNGFWNGIEQFFDVLNENDLIDDTTRSRVIFCDQPEAISDHLTRLDNDTIFSFLDKNTYQCDEDALKDPHAPAMFEFSLDNPQIHPLEELARLTNVMVYNQLYPDTEYMRPIAVLDPDALFETTVKKWLDHMIDEGFALDHDKGTYVSAPTQQALKTKLADLTQRFEGIKSSGDYTTDTLQTKWNNNNLDVIVSQYCWHYLGIRDEFFHPAFEEACQIAPPPWNMPAFEK